MTHRLSGINGQFAANLAQGGYEPKFTWQQLQAAVLAEREACAKVCEEEHDKSKFGVNGMHCAAAIRARSNHG